MTSSSRGESTISCGDAETLTGTAVAKTISSGLADTPGGSAGQTIVAAALIGAIVLLSALFVISNTVRLTVMARARTIEIMRLVGATNWFIRLPFVIESAVQGAVAAEGQ